MTTVGNDEEFRRAIAGLDHAGQRALAARFLANVLSLSGDNAHIIHVAEVAARGPAWQAAMGSRMASTCESIDSAEDRSGSEQQAQYQILSEFIDTQREVS